MCLSLSLFYIRFRAGSGFGECAVVLVEEDGSCMLQRKHMESKLMTEKDFCDGVIKELNFNNFSHGDEILSDSIPGVTIEATAPCHGAGAGIPEELLRALVDLGHSRSRRSQL